jgi:riboflavin kinase/FMN adenylyltransferase
VKVFRSLDEVPHDFGPSAVTIGKFDGVHSGHRAVIATLDEVADAQDLTPTVITFDRNPLELLAPEKCPPALTGIDQKLDLLAGTGVAATLLLTFDRHTADLSPEAFVESILVDRLHARVVLVGADFRFGARGAGDVAKLEQLGEKFGFVVRLIDDVRPEGDRRVSSTWIRELLADGDVAHAARLLGHIPSVRGIVVHGAARGRELGYPTANLSPESEGLIPQDGVYAGWLTDEGVRYPAAISVGNNPTFEGVPQKQVEAYVLDEDLDLYDHRVEIAFVERIRGMVAFSGIDPLIAQIAADVERARAILA